MAAAARGPLEAQSQREAVLIAQVFGDRHVGPVEGKRALLDADAQTQIARVMSGPVPQAEAHDPAVLVRSPHEQGGILVPHAASFQGQLHSAVE